MSKLTRARRKGKTPTSQKARKAILIANGIAALCMFLSWLGQNIYQNDMSSRKSEIERASQFISGELTKALQWDLSYQTEIRKEKPDPDMIWSAALGYAEMTGSIVEAAKSVDPNSPVLTRHVSEHQRMIGGLRDAAKNHNLQAVEEIMLLMMTWFRSIGPESKEAVTMKYQKVAAEESIGEWMFRAFFILGSFVYAITWWKSHSSKDLQMEQAA